MIESCHDATSVVTGGCRYDNLSSDNKLGKMTTIVFHWVSYYEIAFLSHHFSFIWQTMLCQQLLKRSYYICLYKYT